MSFAPSPHDVEAATRRLAAAGCVAADDEAHDLCRAAPNADTLEQWIQRRCVGEPTAWILGWTIFDGLQVMVDPGVYVPRAQSAELVTRAAARIPERGWCADLCTGSGAVAARLQALRPHARIIGTDDDSRAVVCARRNGVAVMQATVGAPLASHHFDVVTAITPYVPSDEMRLLPRDVTAFEPAHALDGGEGGLRILRAVVREAARLLVPGGWLLIELGADQARDVAEDLTTYGFTDSDEWRDDDGDLRGLEAHLSAGSTRRDLESQLWS